jgi:hypothetical protein
MKKPLCFILFLAISTTPACSRFTAAGRRERAYAKYVHKSKIAHERRQAQFRKEKAKIPKPGETESSELREMTRTSEGPQAVPSDPASQ